MSTCSTRNKYTQGFTLIELLVVIAIIGLLSSVVLSALSLARSRGYDAARQSNLVEVRKAIEAYYADNGKYPPSGNPSGSGYGAGNYASQCQIGGYVAANSVISSLVPNYIPSLPTDPQMVAASNYCCYEYAVDSTGANYKFWFAKGGTGSGGTGSACVTSAAGTGALADPVHLASWSVYSAGGASI